MWLFNFLTSNKSEKIKEFKSRDALIIDVRTKAEFIQGAIPGSKNIPLQVLNSQINTIKKLNKPVIVCCASGMRSGSASSILNSQGIECMNGGGWYSLSNKLSWLLLIFPVVSKNLPGRKNSLMTVIL